MFSANAAAAIYEFDHVLGSEITEHGVFDGKSGIFYSSIEKFENASSLFIAYFDGGQLGIEIFDNRDGAEMMDSMVFPLGGKNTYSLSLGVSGSDTAVLLRTNGIEESFVVRNDKFVKSYRKAVKLIELAKYKRGKFKPENKTDVSLFLKSLQNKRIRDSSFNNEVNYIDGDTKKQIMKIVSSCADIMSYDSREFDIDRLTRYVLISHKNFAEVTENKANSYRGSRDIGRSRISYVSEEYIKSVFKSVFGISPPRPYADSLIERGYCVSGGRYYYRELTGEDFHTETGDIIAVYDLGGGVRYAVFSDTYYYGDAKVDEYSYAIIKNDGTLLKIGMGEPLLTDKELTEYMPASLRNDYIYSTNPEHGKVNKIIAIIAAAALMFVALFVWCMARIINRK